MASLRNFAITFCVSLVIFGFLAYYVAVFAADSFAEGFGISRETEEAQTTEAVTEVFNPFDDTTPPESTTIQGNSFNFVLVGLDYCEEIFDDYHESISEILAQALSGVQEEGVDQQLTYEQKRSISADAVLIGRVDKEDRRLTLTCLSGNTRVFVDGVYTDLGSVLINKGVDFYLGKITALTGFAPDYYGIVSIPAMQDIIDELGGLSFRVPCDMEYEDETEGLVISLKEGTQWLTGEDAMHVLRYAGYEDRDISRMGVIRDMAASMMTSVADITTLANAASLFQTVKNGVATNMSLANFSDHLDLIFHIGDFTVVNYAYPGQMIVYNGSPMFEPDTVSALTALLRYRS